MIPHLFVASCVGIYLFITIISIYARINALSLFQQLFPAVLSSAAAARYAAFICIVFEKSLRIKTNSYFTKHKELFKLFLNSSLQSRLYHIISYPVIISLYSMWKVFSDCAGSDAHLAKLICRNITGFSMEENPESGRI